MLAWLAAQTERIRIGSAIFQMPGRSPAMTAMTAATLDQLSGGACCSASALGTAGGRGLARAALRKQLQRTREYVEILRRRAGRERLRTRRDLPAAAAGRPRQALKLTIAPVQDEIPIYIASIGPKNTQLTGEIADGWLPILFPEHVDQSRELLEEGAARARRTLGKEFDIAPA